MNWKLLIRWFDTSRFARHSPRCFDELSTNGGPPIIPSLSRDLSSPPKPWRRLTYRRISKLIFTLLFAAQIICAHPEQVHGVLKEKVEHSDPQNPKRPLRRRHIKREINFYFDNEPLIDFINFLAAEKEINVVFPIGANAINANVTLAFRRQNKPR